MGILLCYGGRKTLWRYTVTLIIKHGVDQFPWKLTGFYGNPESSKQEESWSLLWHLQTHAPSPWLYIGNFNEIVDPSEKEGAIVRRKS